MHAHLSVSQSVDVLRSEWVELVAQYNDAAKGPSRDKMLNTFFVSDPLVALVGGRVETVVETHLKNADKSGDDNGGNGETRPNGDAHATTGRRATEIVMATETQIAAMEEETRETIAAMKAEHQAQMSALRDEYEAQLESLDHAIEEMTKEHDDHVQLLNDMHSTSLTQKQQEHENELQVQHESLSAELTDKMASELNEQRRIARLQLESHESEQSAHVEELHASHHQKVEEIEQHKQSQQEAHASAIAVMKESYKASAKEEKRAHDVAVAQLAEVHSEQLESTTSEHREHVEELTRTHHKERTELSAKMVAEHTSELERLREEHLETRNVMGEEHRRKQEELMANSGATLKELQSSMDQAKARADAEVARLQSRLVEREPCRSQPLLAPTGATFLLYEVLLQKSLTLSPLPLPSRPLALRSFMRPSRATRSRLPARR